MSAVTAAAVKVHPKLAIIVFTCDQHQFRAGLSSPHSPAAAAASAVALAPAKIKP